MFHEFGHLLHHCLSRVAVRSLGGTRVAQDFVELPSQIMENWCSEREALDLFARHYQSNAPLPALLLERMNAASTFRAATMQMRQLGFAAVDLALHIDYTPEKDGDVLRYAREIFAKHAVAPLPEDYAMLASFSHLFGHPVGYAAGYYSYKWAEVLDADAFGRFKAEGVLSRKVGQEFKERLLSQGNSQDPMALFVAFRGRKPRSTRCSSAKGSPDGRPRRDLASARRRRHERRVGGDGELGKRACELGSALGQLAAASCERDRREPRAELGREPRAERPAPAELDRRRERRAGRRAAVELDGSRSRQQRGQYSGDDPDRERLRQISSPAARGRPLAVADHQTGAAPPRDALRSAPSRGLHRRRAQLRERQRGPHGSGKSRQIPAHRHHRLDQPMRSHSAAACATLAAMFRAGSGVPQSDRKADALLARTRELCRFNDAPVCHELPSR